MGICQLTPAFTPDGHHSLKNDGLSLAQIGNLL